MVWVAVLLAFALFLVPTYGGFGFFLKVIAMGGAIGWAFVLKLRSDRSTAEANSAWASGSAYSFFADGTAIAIFPETRILKLRSNWTASGSNVKEYAFADVRGWERNLETGGQGQVHVSPGYGLQGSLNANAAMAHNRRVKKANNRANKAASGLFIEVKDIDHPRWRISMQDEQTQTKWMEILRQHINDDRPLSERVTN